MANVTNADVSFVALVAVKTLLNELVRQSGDDPVALRVRLQAEVEQGLSAFVDKERGGPALNTEGARFLIAALFNNPGSDARN